MIIKLVRHGESQANVADSGQSTVADHIVPLTPRGFDQAREVGRDGRQQVIDQSQQHLPGTLHDGLI